MSGALLLRLDRADASDRDVMRETIMMMRSDERRRLGLSVVRRAFSNGLRVAAMRF